MINDNCQTIKKIGENYTSTFFDFANSLTIAYFTYVVSINIKYYQSNFGEIISSYSDFDDDTTYEKLKKDNKQILINSMCLSTGFYILTMIIFYKIIKNNPKFISCFGNSYSKVTIEKCNTQKNKKIKKKK